MLVHCTDYRMCSSELLVRSTDYGIICLDLLVCCTDCGMSSSDLWVRCTNRGKSSEDLEEKHLFHIRKTSIQTSRTTLQSGCIHAFSLLWDFVVLTVWLLA